MKTEAIEKCIDSCLSILVALDRMAGRDVEANVKEGVVVEARAELDALLAENERLREAVRGLLSLSLLIGSLQENGRYNTHGQVLIHQHQKEECGAAVQAGQAVLKTERSLHEQAH
jgi:hypothetical protein